MNLKPISNNVISKVENMIKNGYTYKQIREATGISDGTIAKVKQGKITSNRKSLNYIYITSKEYGKIKKTLLNFKETLLNKENEIIKLSKRIKELEVYEYKYLELLEVNQKINNLNLNTNKINNSKQIHCSNMNLNL